MNILIIENEIYLAQSIASKLSDLSHNCDISSSTKEGLRGIAYDVILLSTNISGQDIYPVIEAYKNAVVILMVSYVSNDTVSKPLAAGAKDYILKPFMIEELIRKIQHFQNHERLRRQNQTYERYLTHTFNSINVDEDLDKVELPSLFAADIKSMLTHLHSAMRHITIKRSSLSPSLRLKRLAILQRSTTTRFFLSPIFKTSKKVNTNPFMS